MTTHFAAYEKHPRGLKRIAEGLDKQSAEFSALERAGWALAFVTMYHNEQFEQFITEKSRGELSSEQVAHLKKLGLQTE